MDCVHYFSICWGKFELMRDHENVNPKKKWCKDLPNPIFEFMGALDIKIIQTGPAEITDKQFELLKIKLEQKNEIL